MFNERITLISSDYQRFTMNYHLTHMSKFIQIITEYLDPESIGDDFEVYTQVPSRVLKKVSEWCVYHSDIAVESDEEGEDAWSINEWDKKHFENDLTLLFDIIGVGEYLQIQKLAESACKIIASMIINQTPQDVVKIFKVVHNIDIKSIELDSSWKKLDNDYVQVFWRKRKSEDS